MEKMTRAELKALTEEHAGPCVSLFLPTATHAAKFAEAPIRLKTLLGEAEARLGASGMRPREIGALLAPARKLLDDRLFWHHPASGLALFLSPQASYQYRLPIPCGEQVVVTHRFHLKPLFPLLSGDGEFYVLALSQNQVRLLHGTRNAIEPMEAASLPQSLADALRFDEVRKPLQLHTAGAGAPGTGAVFHGHDPADDAKEQLFHYFRRIDTGLQELLGRGGVPLVLAGVEYLAPIYAEANTYPQMLAAMIPGNPETLKDEELHREAWAIVEPHYAKAQRNAAAQYRELAGTGRTANTMQEIAEASRHARVETLFVALGEKQWGTITPRAVALLDTAEQTGAEDLLDYAAVQTFRNGGTVYAVPPEEVPDQALAAAILRW